MVKRDSLKNGHGAKKLIDMERVYAQLDSGRSVKDVASEWGVSESTLYRRHREYQNMRIALEQERDSLPPLPEELGDPGDTYVDRL